MKEPKRNKTHSICEGIMDSNKRKGMFWHANQENVLGKKTEKRADCERDATNHTRNWPEFLTRKNRNPREKTLSYFSSFPLSPLPFPDPLCGKKERESTQQTEETRTD